MALLVNPRKRKRIANRRKRKPSARLPRRKTMTKKRGGETFMAKRRKARRNPFEELMLVNPKKRKKRRKYRRRKLTAKKAMQKWAWLKGEEKMAKRKYKKRKGKRRRTAGKKRRMKTFRGRIVSGKVVAKGRINRRRKRRRNPVGSVALAANPRRRRRRRNPKLLGLGIELPSNLAMKTLYGGAGIIGGVLLVNLVLKRQIESGSISKPLVLAAYAGGAIATGMLMSRFVSKEAGTLATLAGVTYAAYRLFTEEILQNKVPQLTPLAAETFIDESLASIDDELSSIDAQLAGLGQSYEMVTGPTQLRGLGQSYEMVEPSSGIGSLEENFYQQWSGFGQEGDEESEYIIAEEEGF